MKPFFFVPLLLLICVSGCNYTSPITDSGTAIDTRLLGSWTGRDPNGSNPRLRFRKLNETEYLIEYFEGKKAKDYGKGFLSVIQDVRFINYQDAGNSKFMFAAYAFDAKGRLVLRFPDLKSPDTASSFEIRQEIRRRLTEGSLFKQEATIWQKVKN